MVPPEDDKGKQPRKTSAELEAEALKAYESGKRARAAKRDALKRPAAAGGTSATSGAAKRRKKGETGAVAAAKAAPKAAPKKAIQAEPSAQAYKLNRKIDMKDVFKRLRKLTKSEIKRNAFNSRAYGPAKARAINEGADVKLANDVGRINSANASGIYDKLPA